MTWTILDGKTKITRPRADHFIFVETLKYDKYAWYNFDVQVQ